MPQATIVEHVPTRSRPPRGPLTALLDLFSNVWFGIFWAVMMFIYCSIGSAVPKIRQLPWLEMTEFQWFHWWPFNLIVIMIVSCMIVITVRRIPLRPINAGVWMIHTGIVILMIGSYVYFSTKVEGDAPVFRRQVRAMLPGLTQPASFVALPGCLAEVPARNGTWRFEVQSTNSAWPILSDEHEGETAYAVNVMVRPPRGEPFVRQLLDGYPQYTEDVLPGQGRAVKNIGRKLVAEELELTLGYEPTTEFHVMETWALYVRRLGEMEWKERPIEGVPRYNDYVASREWVITHPRMRLPIRPIDIEVPPADDGDPLAGASVNVTGYLRYAQMRRIWRESGSQLFPVLTLTSIGDRGEEQQFELMALDPARRSAAEGLIEFVWAGSANQLANLPRSASASVTLEVPATGKSYDIELTDETVVDRDGPYTPIDGTEFSFRIRGTQDRLTLPDGQRTVSVALVDIKNPEGEFTRWVADLPSMTRDLHRSGPEGTGDPHAADPREPDERLRFTYSPAGPPIILAAHPDGIQFVFNGPDGRMIDKPVAVGEKVEVVPGLALRIDGLWTHAVGEVKPYVVPPEQRNRDAREMFSMIRVEVNAGGTTQAKWLNFNRYALPTSQYAYRRRFTYQPEVFELPGGRMVEVLLSRERRALPHAIALDHFDLDTHFGGYTGQVSTIRNYVSDLRFYDDGSWTDTPRTIAVNSPTEYGGLWYFQSMWDKPTRNNPNGGMNYTGLGIGNRNGVYTQLLGCCLAVIGMIFAFYVKPIMVRRRAQAAHARAARGQPVSSATGEPVRIEEPIEV